MQLLGLFGFCTLLAADFRSPFSSAASMRDGAEKLFPGHDSAREHKGKSRGSIEWRKSGDDRGRKYQGARVAQSTTWPQSASGRTSGIAASAHSSEQGDGDWRRLSSQKLSGAAIVGAVMELYVEESYPFEYLVQWQLQASTGEEVSTVEIWEAASTVPEVLELKRAKTGFAILLKKPPRNFQGFADQISDCVQPDVYEEAVALVMEGCWPMPSSPNHDRAALATWLREKSGYQPLQQLSLGRGLALVNHLLSSCSVLGKRNGRLVPYFFSDEYDKQENAKRSAPTGLRMDEAYVASWPELMECLDIILDAHGGELHTARLKAEFRSRLRMELCETALGYVTLGGLLDDPRLMAEFDMIKQPPAPDVLRSRRSDHSGAGDSGTSGKAAGSFQRHRRGSLCSSSDFDRDLSTGCLQGLRAETGKQRALASAETEAAASDAESVSVKRSHGWMLHYALLKAMKEDVEPSLLNAGLRREAGNAIKP
eukprot:TRINITY_DN31313_c0_g1_i1.p1 TRINITY_DN31313_c0_g1~~TRINITY_DN31313_c0_g1_i1.p1  ORF type:complete len:483 (-),score=93.53 TRINITY_DN31313_c0_g1_i1:109-1557(-)